MTTPAKKSAFKDINLEITHYDTDELLAMLNLTDPTEDDIIRATDRLIAKANADRLPKVAAFFQDAQDALLDELYPDPPEEDAEYAEYPQEEDSTSEQGQLGQWWHNQYLKQADKAQADKPADRSAATDVDR